MISVGQKLLLMMLIFFHTGSVALASHELVTLTVKNPDPYTGNQSWFVYTKNPGDTIDDIATIKNYGEETVFVRIYAVDAATSDTGSFILKFQHEDQDGIGDWSTISKNDISIKPGERIDVPFKIKIPETISPGQYIGGIIIEYGPNVTQGNSKDCATNGNCGSSIVSVKTRIGSRIYLTIPGQTEEKVSLTDFSYYTTLTGQARFKLKIVNQGNVVYQPQAEITVRDSKGNVFDTFSKPLGTSMPDSVIEPIITWDKNRPLTANFSATASVTFPRRFQVAGEILHGAPMVKTISFVIIPWDHIFYLSIIALIAVCLCAMHTMRLKHEISDGTEYRILEGDDIISIAEKNKTSWRKLAELNDIKPPYILKKGASIVIPKPDKKRQ